MTHLSRNVLNVCVLKRLFLLQPPQGDKSLNTPGPPVCLFLFVFPAGGCKCVRPTKISDDWATGGMMNKLHPPAAPWWAKQTFRLNRSCSLCCVWVGCVCISLLPLTLLFSVYFLRSFPSLPAFLRPSSSSSFCLLRLILRVFSHLPFLSLSRLKMM